MSRLNQQQGSIIIYAIILLTIIVTIAISITAVFIPKLKISSDAISSTTALYAADSGIEWCLYLNRGKPNPPVKPTLPSGISLDIFYNNSPASCTSSENPLNHRAIGTYRDISRSLEVTNP